MSFFGTVAAICAAIGVLVLYFLDDPSSVVSTIVKNEVIEWEHGYKTDRVIVTRMRSDTLGWNIKFEFPKDAYNADAAALSWAIEEHGGQVYQGGGYPGAPLYAAFNGLDSKEKTDAKAKEMAPVMDERIRGVARGKKYTEPKPEYEWPNCAPLDKNDPYWETNNNLNINGIQYKKEEVALGRWQYVVDQKAMQSLREFEERRRALFSALKTRVLSDEEMRQVAAYGFSLNVENMMPYSAEEKARELNWALQMQQTLRAGAK